MIADCSLNNIARSELRGALRTLRAAVSGNECDFKMVSNTLHRIKPILCHLGQLDLAEECYNLQQTLDNNRSKKTVEAIAEVVQKLEQFD